MTTRDQVATRDLLSSLANKYQQYALLTIVLALIFGPVSAFAQQFGADPVALNVGGSIVGGTDQTVSATVVMNETPTSTTPLAFTDTLGECATVVCPPPPAWNANICYATAQTFQVVYTGCYAKSVPTIDTLYVFNEYDGSPKVQASLLVLPSDANIGPCGGGPGGGSNAPDSGCPTQAGDPI